MKCRPAPQLVAKMPAPNVTADQILLYGNKQSRPIRLDANVIVYFADIFMKKCAGAQTRPAKS